MCIEPRALISTKSIPQALQHFAAGQISGPLGEQCNQLSELIDMWADSAVCGESFRLRKFLTDDEVFSPIKINACMEWHLYDSARPLFQQTASQAKTKWTDERLKRAKTGGQPWWVVGQDHARDGVRHGGLFLERARQQPDLRGRAWPHLFNLKGELKAA